MVKSIGDHAIYDDHDQAFLVDNEYELATVIGLISDN